ncbi:MAG: hypothetical protein JRF37_10720 [Deltaproteobacteria bacterium]|nr:hypothetical protein [Deltaproteobacteria bacterium]
MKQLRLFFVLAFVFAWPVILFSADGGVDPKPALNASLDRQSAKVGDTITLTLDYHLPKGARLPEKPDIKGLEGLTVLGHRQMRMKLLVDQLKSWTTGPISLSYLDKEGKTETLACEPVSIEVLSSLGEKPEKVQLRPIRGIVPTSLVWLKRLPWVVGALSILLVIGAGLFWWRRKRSFQQLDAELVDPPYIRARSRIEQLESQGLFEKGYAKQYYFGLSEILRQYLGAIRGFAAVEATTEEIALRIGEKDRVLLSLLRQADLVKFADLIPPVARKGEDLKTALSYIQETAPVEEEGDNYSKNKIPQDRETAVGADHDGKEAGIS